MKPFRVWGRRRLIDELWYQMWVAELSLPQLNGKVCESKHKINAVYSILQGLYMYRYFYTASKNSLQSPQPVGGKPYSRQKMHWNVNLTSYLFIIFSVYCRCKSMTVEFFLQQNSTFS